MAYTYNKYYSMFKKEGNMPYVTRCINIEVIMRSGKSQLQEKYYMLLLLYLKIAKLLEAESTTVVASIFLAAGRGWGGGMRSCCSMGIKFQLQKMNKF